MNPQLVSKLKQLRLSGLISTLEVRLTEAAGNQLNHQEFLELLVNDELAIRGDRAIARRIKKAGFRELKSIEDFDFSFNPSIKRRQIMELAAGRFIREKTDMLILGPPGVGKSHLVQAIGHQAAKVGFAVLYRSIFDTISELIQAENFGDSVKMMKRYLMPDLLIIDDMGIKKLPKQSGEYLFEIIMRRHELRSTIMTSNRPLEEWGKLIGDVPTATAILDRILQKAEIIQITGRSYRLKDRANKQKREEKKNV
ncbi:MAG: IS21-like element helper ATPase IstB [candidate division Zixibacteria bacterium]|nr:IS21-like element helper ATPase IstB [candidate division Zixibacteria bacterium]